MNGVDFCWVFAESPSRPDLQTFSAVSLSLLVPCWCLTIGMLSNQTCLSFLQHGAATKMSRKFTWSWMFRSYIPEEAPCSTGGEGSSGHLWPFFAKLEVEKRVPLRKLAQCFRASLCMVAQLQTMRSMAAGVASSVPNSSSLCASPC